MSTRLLSLIALSATLITVTSISLWRRSSIPQRSNRHISQIITLDSLRREWPLGDPSSEALPQIFVNQTPLFQAQYVHARRSIKPHLHKRREVILRQMIRDELIRQRASALDDLSEVELKEVTRAPRPDEEWMSYRERLYHAHSALSRSVEPRGSVLKYLTRDETDGADEIRSAKLSLSYRGYFVSLSDLTMSERHRAVSQLKKLERRLSMKQIRWSELNRSMLDSAESISTERALIEAVPSAIREYFEQSSPPMAGQQLPLIITQDAAWWVRISEVNRVQSVTLGQEVTPHARPDVNQALQELIDQAVREALIEVSIDHLTSVTIERLKEKSLHLKDRLNRFSLILPTPPTSPPPQL